MDRRLGLLALGIAGLACGKRDSPHPSPPVAVIVDAAPAIVDAAPVDPQVAAGQQIWGRYCALCHGPTAMGYAADNAPSLVTSTFLETASDEFLRAGIVRGRPGTAMAGYGKAVGGPLDDIRVGQLIAFIRAGAPPPVALPATPVQGDAARGEVVYGQSCQECHGTPDTRGIAVHLYNPVFLETASDAFLRHAVAFGRPGTKMIGYAGTLAESDIDAVVAHLRSKAKPVEPTPKPVDPTAKPPANVVINPKGKAPSFTPRDGRYVSVEQVKKALDQKRRIIILDARAPSDWIRMHIPGSVSAPYYQLDRLDAIPNDGTWVIAYCACPHHASGILVDELRKRGHANAAVLDEGILVWQKLGFPVVDADGKKVTAPPKPAPHNHNHSHQHDHPH
jgi:cytochrome c oxidase cbb3-type subunit 3/ubiquinol-cytochrome c reductase cytochrome c subunit